MLGAFVIRPAVKAQAQEQNVELLAQSWAPGSEDRYQVIYALLLSRSGYLWVGTNKGLTRFDGVRFTDFPFATTPGMSRAPTNFNAMWEDRGGGIWVGTRAGVTHYDGVRFSSLTDRDGLPANSVVRVDGDAEGAVWIFTAKGVCRWKSGRLTIAHPELDGGEQGDLISAQPNISGDAARIGLWRLHGDELQRFAYGHWSDFPISPGNIHDRQIFFRNIYEDSLHRVWYSLFSAVGKYYEVCSERSLIEYSGLPANAHVFFRDRDGFLWLTDHQAHTARWKDRRLYPLPYLKTPYLTHMVEAPDEGIWAGTFFTRLFLFRRRLITEIPMPHSPEVGPLLFRQRNGTVWAVSTDLERFEKDRLTTVASLGIGPRWGVAGAIGEDGFGKLLFGDRSRPGVFTLEGHSIVASSLYSSVRGRVQAILTDSNGEIWFGTTKGLFHKSKGKIESIAGLEGFDVNCLLESNPGHLWVGTVEGPAFLSNGKITPVRASSPWLYGSITSFSQDPEGSIWLSTYDHGIFHIEGGQLWPLNKDGGLPTNGIYSVDASDERYLWLRTDSGLLRIDKRSLEHAGPAAKAELKVAQFDETDGLPANSMQPPGNQCALHFPNGTVWFSSLGGIAVVQPDTMQHLPSRPHPVIEEHIIDASDLHHSDPGGITLKPDQSSLQIRYTALGSYHPEQVQFRYRMTGIDNTWIFAGTRRIAFYTHLTPGRYTFLLQAADGDERGWTGPEAHIAVHILTPFYRTWWMELLVVLSGLTLLAVAAERRRRRMMETQRVRQAFTHRLISSQEGERKRIAHELHDGLGQHLALIRTLAMLPTHGASASSMPAGDEREAEPLTLIAEQAAVAIHEVEAISYDLRPYQLDRLGLTKAVRSLVRKVEESNALLVRGSIDDIDGFFPPELEINMYRIVQEAISNILKHSAASEAMILVTRRDGRLRLVVEDNGAGFSPAEVESRTGSLGLIGIRERAEVLGGRAAIESDIQTGTRVTVEFTRISTASNGDGGR